MPGFDSQCSDNHRSNHHLATFGAGMDAVGNILLEELRVVIEDFLPMGIMIYEQELPVLGYLAVHLVIVLDLGPLLQMNSDRRIHHHEHDFTIGV